jgi:hypothetical protein
VGAEENMRICGGGEGGGGKRDMAPRRARATVGDVLNIQHAKEKGKGSQRDREGKGD